MLTSRHLVGSERHHADAVPGAMADARGGGTPPQAAREHATLPPPREGSRRLRIAVPLLAGHEWRGGVNSVLSLVKALGELPEAERPEIVLVVVPGTLAALDHHAAALTRIDEFAFVGSPNPPPARPKFEAYASLDELFERVDLMIPLLVQAQPGKAAASWVPDFQHHHLPQYFSATELAHRESWERTIATGANLMILSSESARRDWQRLHPHAVPEITILRFRTSPDDSWYQGDPIAVADKHGLPSRFLIACNQFWQHKGHDTLFEALAVARAAGVELDLVCTGGTADHRSASYFPELEARLTTTGLAARVHLLGLVPRAEQLALIRRSLAVVQPSRFEGWSTVVEDARALGKELVLSDIDVHREQAPPYATYFKTGDAHDLARALAHVWRHGEPGPSLAKEHLAREESRELVREYGRTVCALAREAPRILGRAAWRRSRSLPGSGTGTGTALG